MIEDLKPYPEYKDSGVSWLGEVPEHWDVRRLKYLLRERDVRSADGSEQLLRVSQYAGVTERKQIKGDNGLDSRAESLVGYKLVERNDLVVNIMLAWNGSMGVSEFPGVASPAYCVYHFRREAHPWYFHNLLRSPSYKARIKAVSTGVVESRLRLYTDDLYRLEALFAPLPEQTSIVRFLDWAELRIRRVIRARQRRIKLLEERIAIMATEAMCHPAHRLERISTIGVQQLRPVTRDNDQCYVALGLYNRGRGLFHKPLTLGADLGDSNFYWVQPGDLVISGQFAWEGAVALASAYEQDTIVSHRYYLIRGREGIATTPYLWAVLRSDFGDMVLDQHSRGAAGRNRPLNLRKLMKEKIPVPPYDEQLAIDALMKSIAPIRYNAEREIALLREFRTRLIADVVTGKLDVREVATKLPDEPAEEEAEPLGEEMASESEEPVDGEGAESFEEEETAS
jgi:type I restriction enzyme S subunit